MIRVAIVDDHPVVLRGLSRIIADESDMQLTGQATDATSLLDLLKTHPLDVLLLDLSLPGRTGLDILADLHVSHPKLHVLILSSFPPERFAVRAILAGAAGYLSKDMEASDLVAAIRQVAHGGKYITPEIGEALAERLLTLEKGPPIESLSGREYSVMQRLVEGQTVTDIATELNLSIKTISTYRTRILDKLHLDNNSQLTRYAIDNKLLPKL